MTFSTDGNGFSLNQLYRRSMEQDHDSPSLLIVKDIEQNVRLKKKIDLFDRNINWFFFFSWVIDFWCLYFTTIDD